MLWSSVNLGTTSTMTTMSPGTCATKTPLTATSPVTAMQVVRAHRLRYRVQQDQHRVAAERSNGSRVDELNCSDAIEHH